jgi:hypothetical protein
VSYSSLSEKVEKFFEVMLGQNVYKPVVNAYHSKLHSSTCTLQELALLEHKTPRFLSVIVTPDNQMNSHLEEDSTGTLVAMRWDVLKDYAGSTLDAMMTKPESVH